MNELEPRARELELPAHGPGRALGQKRKPQLRLALGYRDEARHGAPVKTSYFVPSGDDRAVAKFMGEYGDKPRAVDIRLPGSLPGFLDIHHVAFAGGQRGEGGYLRARGAQNFAALGVLGGADMLTVYEKVETQEGPTALAVEEVPIRNVYDDAAVKLGVYLRMVVSFGLPQVLGFSGLCQVTTRSKESIDTLWQQAVDLYGRYGSFVMVALKPKLLLKKSSMLTPLGTRAELYVLDLWVPETDAEVERRLERHHELVPERGAASRALLYAESSGDHEEPTAEAGPALTPGQSPTGAVAEAVHLSDEPPSSPEPPDEPDQDEWPDWPDDKPDWSGEPPPSLLDPPDSAIAEAAAMTFPSGKYAGVTLVDVAMTGKGRDYLKWAAEHWQPGKFADAVRRYSDGLP